jgi:hypothetical protein
MMNALNIWHVIELLENVKIPVRWVQLDVMLTKDVKYELIDQFVYANLDL